MLFLGIDIGSAVSKCVITDETEAIRGKGLSPGGAGTGGPQAAVAMALADAGAAAGDIAATVATGYGRNLAAAADSTMSELSCHAAGAVKLYPGVRTVIDIGGQDAKVLSITPAGKLDSFIMNDKCAAGTGRFLEEMSRVLAVPIDEMADVAGRAAHELQISSTCVVFAETEVISRMAEGAAVGDVLAGIFAAIAARVGALAKRKGVVPEVVMTGGVAKNEGMRRALERELGTPIHVDPLAQYAGALGAALFASQSGL
ncbi:MAG: acyl-CoA dehydratase activase [Clostridiales Family XIII bacterium]|jgi:predicted CoA-substrate-specific enzyme activase|nr:acyl-CoA dehydratase activase [Clostridiales Family XIII bacterium]